MPLLLPKHWVQSREGRPARQTTPNASSHQPCSFRRCKRFELKWLTLAFIPWQDHVPTCTDPFGSPLHWLKILETPGRPHKGKCSLGALALYKAISAMHRMQKGMQCQQKLQWPGKIRGKKLQTSAWMFCHYSFSDGLSPLQHVAVLGLQD